MIGVRGYKSRLRTKNGARKCPFFLGPDLPCDARWLLFFRHTVCFQAQLVFVFFHNYFLLDGFIGRSTCENWITIRPEGVRPLSQTDNWLEKYDFPLPEAGVFGPVLVPSMNSRYFVLKHHQAVNNALNDTPDPVG